MFPICGHAMSGVFFDKESLCDNPFTVPTKFGNPIIFATPFGVTTVIDVQEARSRTCLSTVLITHIGAVVNYSQVGTAVIKGVAVDMVNVESGQWLTN